MIEYLRSQVPRSEGRKDSLAVLSKIIYRPLHIQTRALLLMLSLHKYGPVKCFRLKSDQPDFSKDLLCANPFVVRIYSTMRKKFRCTIWNLQRIHRTHSGVMK